ncbi:E3 ubiquitin-protein ligase RNF212B-like [Narcine bancroftii]|uniref:E3 ubiquitin-protein ligase RNF212B-like n=1 Tax=Narcine bancroftii TaxID=1343680 RepID=UPI003831F479
MTCPRVSRGAAEGSRMDWFHCNKCYQKPASGIHFSISSCQHILCHKCISRDKCSVCGSACKHLPLTDNMTAHERMYFRKPSDICKKYMEHIAQVTKFQRKQTELLLSFYKHKVSQMELTLQKAQCKIRAQEKELAALKTQMSEMKQLLTLKASPNLSQLRRSSTPRPIAITSPSSRVTPKQTPQDNRPHSGNAAPYSRPELMAQVTGSSVSRSSGLLTPRGSTLASGMSTPWDVVMSSSSVASADSLMYRSLGRSLSGGLDTNTVQQAGLTGSQETPARSIEPRRQIQLNTTPRTVILRQPSVCFHACPGREDLHALASQP